MFSDYSILGPMMGVAAAVYLVPSFVGVLRRQHNLQTIFGVNLLLGWTLVGWIVALRWALAGRERGPSILSASRWSRSGHIPCPSCGHSLRKTARRCRSCGYTLRTKE